MRYTVEDVWNTVLCRRWRKKDIAALFGKRKTVALSQIAACKKVPLFDVRWVCSQLDHSADYVVRMAIHGAGLCFLHSDDLFYRSICLRDPDYEAKARPIVVKALREYEAAHA